MWLKKLFNPKLPSSTSPNNIQQQNLESSMFEVQQASQQTHPLIDTSPDIRYSSLLVYEKNKLPFPHTLLHQSQIVFMFKPSFEDGFMARSGFNNTTTPCKIVLTDRQIIICPNVFSIDRQLSTKSLNSNYLDIMHGHIEKMELKQIKKESLKLFLTLNDNRQLVITNKMGDNVKEMHQLISKFAFVKGINKFYAFQYRKFSKKNQEIVRKGWQVYSIRGQFSRQGATKFFNYGDEKQLKNAYKIVKNYNFDISPTYPQEFFVPYNMSSDQILRATKFRTRQRIPALSYLYEYKTDSYASLFRCSQIKTGLMGNRCEQDEKMIKQIVQSSNFISKTKKIYSRNNLKIYDARGYYAALGNMLAGKGYEKQDVYNCEVQFLNIPNIHAVRDSYSKVKASDYSTQQLYSILSASGWVQYVFLILSGSKSMALDLIGGKNVLVHCSDGWDRTSQLSSLAQLLLDPYFRTLEGLAVLIEKDWRHFGHKYRDRTGQYHPTNYRPYEKSQVFIQFLDCIYQILCQFPLSFEYNHQFLQYLAFHVDSCVYGNFLPNNMKENTQIKIQQETISIWTDIIYDQKHQHLYLNPFYQKDLNIGFLNVSLEMKNMKIWKQHLMCQTTSQHVAEFIYSKEKEINKALREQFLKNQQKIQQLHKQINNKA